MKRCKVLRSGVISQQIEGKSHERKKGDEISLSDEAYEHLRNIDVVELIDDVSSGPRPTPARKRAER